MKDIAVIIPVYKAHETIKKTLYSVFMQKAIEFNCYLVVDGEKKGSYDYLKDLFDIEIYYKDKNDGVGLTRQYGIDNTKEPYISIIDADDTYLSSLALYYQHRPFNDDSIALVVTSFLQEFKDHSVKVKALDMIWMHGKMYKRSFLDKYNIRFNKTRANEDVGFNTKCICYSNDNERVHAEQGTTYLWQWRDNSTVREDNYEYELGKGLNDFVYNMIDAIETVLDTRPISEMVKYVVLNGLITLYGKYNIATEKKPKYIKNVLNISKQYHKALYKYVNNEYIEQNGIKLFNTQADYKVYEKWVDSL